MLSSKPCNSSYWLKKIKNPPLVHIPKCDIAIIGSGVSGASLSYHLSIISPHKNVLLIDARGIAGGATGRNGGLLRPGLPDRWSTLVKTYGLDETKKVLDFSLKNCEDLKAFVSSIPENDQNHPKLNQFGKGSIQLIEDKEELELWRKEVDEMKMEGGKVYEIWDKDELKSRLKTTKEYAGAVCDLIAYSLRPSDLVFHLIKKSMSNFGDNFNLMAGSTVLQVTEDTENVVLETSTGQIQAGQVVYCTNAYTNQLLPEAHITPVRNQVVLTKPLEYNPFDFAITANHGYEYLSVREDQRIILGGMRYLGTNLDVGTSDDSNLDPNISAGLHSYLDKNFPELQDKIDIEEEWAGIMGFSPDSLPFVGKLPMGSRQYISAGFSGHGMPRAFLCAKAVAQQLVGKDVDLTFPRSFSPENRFGKVREGGFNSKI